MKRLNQAGKISLAVISFLIIGFLAVLVTPGQTAPDSPIVVELKKMSQTYATGSAPTTLAVAGSQTITCTYPTKFASFQMSGVAGSGAATMIAKASVDGINYGNPTTIIGAGNAVATGTINNLWASSYSVTILAPAASTTISAYGVAGK